MMQLCKFIIYLSNSHFSFNSQSSEPVSNTINDNDSPNAESYDIQYYSDTGLATEIA